jgi:O-antigen/teichoic acid export membrane protein
MFWAYVSWVITCIIILPALLFLYQVVSENLRKFLRWLLVAHAVLALFGILAAALGVSLAKLGIAYSIVLLSTLVATGLFLVASKRHPGPRKRLTREIRVFIAGFSRFPFVHRACKSQES